ncbi:DNA-deoxyinosine glycosylase [Tsuneonella dongtanensis]|uniref:DNA-deoxyinosine glycosylase n=1 Tax=Tsuneonella dongtanensis TaxID=692370 RepID=UPI001E378B0E|nr:DNA-deoxyinosine glycosylase [Tsuneonella dongtanensis]
MAHPSRQPRDGRRGGGDRQAHRRARAGELSVRKTAFAPVAAGDARVLILGSLPGDASLAAGRYYAHPQNRFWHLVGHVIGSDVSHLAYEERLDALKSAGIALWDTVASARREGSLDAAIREASHAPLADLAAGLPDLRAVAFNGRKASAIGRPQLAGRDLALIDLPSSSPAFAAMPLADKERLWARLADFLI